MQEGIVKNLKWLGLDGQALTAGKSGKTPPGQLNGTGGKPNPAEPNRYYYHPDHLGSTSYITDATGEVYQHLEYFAFGETFVEEHSNTNRTPYLYNGKELDEETGLYYYGARYYDAQTSVWISVDPLAEDYPNVNPYAYVLNNPINYIDPNGMEVEFSESTSRKDKRAFMSKQRKLNRGSKTARKQWRVLKRSENIHTIHVNEKNKDGKYRHNETVEKGKINRKDGNGTDIYIDLDGKANITKGDPSEYSPIEIGIGHEEGHAFRLDQGLVPEIDNSNIDMFNDTPEQQINKLHENVERWNINEEKEASHIENIIRAEYDPKQKIIGLRRVYSNIERTRKVNGVIINDKHPPVNVIRSGYKYYKND